MSAALTARVDRLRVDDEAFLVTSLIDRCPKVMMLRELVQNAIEAAARAPEGERRVDIGARPLDGVRKLVIRNTGPGLGPQELFRMCDLAASVGKQKALDGNFGMGAKVASLVSNQLGMRYRSCRAGRVHEVVIGKRDGIYGRIRRTDPILPRGVPGGVEVLDVTGIAVAEDAPRDHDWTEVMLCGNDAGQDTLVDPFGRDPVVPADWIPDGLRQRFFRLPNGVEVRLASETLGGRDAARFEPMAARLAAGGFAACETVALAAGGAVHFAHAPESGDGVGAIAWRDELYDVRRDWRWVQLGPSFGLSFGARQISVVVELPPDAPVVVDAYRQFLRYAEGEQGVVELSDFAALAAANRPGWLLELMRRLAPDTRMVSSVADELGALLRGLGVRPTPRRPAPRAAAATLALVTPERPLAEPASPIVTTPDATATDARDGGGGPTLAAAPRDAVEATPEIVLLRDDRHIHDRLLDGRAAGYDPASHELFINLGYPPIDALARDVAAEIGGPADCASVVRSVSLEAAEEVTVRRIGRALVYGLAKRHATPPWNRWQLEGAISPEALTQAADDHLWSRPEATALARRKLAACRAPLDSPPGPPRPDQAT